MEPGTEGHDVYVAQLQEVFDSCDSGGDGRLTQQELVTLCSRLQLDDQADALVDKLLGDDSNGTVTFDQFKEGFVSVLSQSVEGLDATSEEEDPSTANDLSDGQDDVSPKFVKGSKKYGRRSRPVGATSGDGDSDTELSSTSPRPGPKEQAQAGDEGPVDPEELKIPVDDLPETFEAEGQLNQSIAEMENALDPVSEEQHLRDIWRELGMGTDGSLTLNELATVCDHIGMEEMNAEELQHLFDKLDVDSDGRVSFHEFLHGLFTHGGPSTPAATPVRPQSTPRQKLRLAVIATFEDRPQTPSFITSISGLFSTIDPEGTGYASADDIVELWEKLGVSQGHDILDYLQFERHTKVALADLSAALEQEMRTVEEDNATYRAAVVSYQHELKFLKTMSDTAAAERDKLRQDLTEANARIALLIKEGDERQAAGDDKRERELLSLEARYQEQLRTLQAEVDGEQEALSQQSARQRARLEQEVARLKEDEARLREKLSQTQRELERLEHDILELAEKCADLEKVNARQQRELEEAETMKLRLEELESSQAAIAEEQSRWQTDRVHQLETERTDLKDKNDELTIQVEELRQQLASAARRRSRGARPRDASPGPGRTGSVLSDYQRPPVVVRRSSDTVSSEDEEGSLTGSGSIRRRLPQPPSTLTVAEEEALRAEIEGLRKEKEEWARASDQEAQERETEQRISQLTRNFSIERKDIEQSYRLEITDIEEQHAQDREKLLQHFEREKVALREEADADWEERLASREEALRQTLEEEKRDLLIRAESEKNLLKQQLAEQKAALRTGLEAELAEETAAKIREAEDRFNHQLETMVSQDRTDQSHAKRVAELELQMKLQREELELAFDRERQALRQAGDEEQGRLHQQYRQQIADLQNTLAGGEDALEGKLREDFNRLLDQHRAKISKEESERMSGDLVNLNATVRQLREEKDRLQEEHAGQLREALEVHGAELRAAEEAHQQALRAAHDEHQLVLTTSGQLKSEEVAALQTRLDRRLANAQSEHEEARQEAQRRHEQEQVALEEQLARTCEELISAQTRLEAERTDRQRLERALREAEAQQQRHLSVLEGEKEDAERAGEASRAALEEQLEAEIQARLEEDFLAQIQRLKEVFSEEREQLENRIRLLQTELDERAADTQSIVDVSRVEALTAENLTLRCQKSDAEQRTDDVTKHYRRLLEDKDTTMRTLETRLRTLESERVSIIERPVRAVTVSAPPPSSGNPSISERAILAALDRHHQLLESTKGELRSEIRGLGSAAQQPPEVEVSSSHMEELLVVRREQENLVRELEQSTAKVVELETALSLAQSEYQREVRTLQADLAGKVDPAEVTRLQEQLAGAQRKAAQLQAMWDQRATETNKMIKSSSESHAAALRKAETERDELARQLTTRQAVLDEQVTRLRDQMEKNSRRDLLIKDLYVENSNLVKSLYETEKREKEVNSRALRLEERCGLLQVIVQKVTHAALA